LRKHKIKASYIVMLPPITSEAGDNYTGDEFVLWNKIYHQDQTPYYYIGFKQYVKYLYQRLKLTINQTFNEEKTRVIRKNRLKKIFRAIPVKFESFHYITDHVKIYYGISNIQIYYKENLIYSWRENCPSVSINVVIKKMLNPFENRKTRYIADSIMVTPLGRGNGFNGRSSNFIIQYANRVIWVDPMAEPLLALKRIKLHWNKITDYFISHIHEDHIEGLSAILKLALLRNHRINIITTQKIFNKLNQIFSFLFPDFLHLVNHINITPESPLPYHQGYLSIRFNHHVLKSGTLGLKVKYKNNCFALSGDTYYSEEFEKKYPDHPAFSPDWYREAHLVFHEAEFFNKHTSHTFYTELKKLQEKVKAPILTYHNSANRFLLPAVKEYKTYIIKKEKLYCS
ncbi:MAG: MBL fold metallo-hydrolase, partial [bacterium]|nr:MBL fold metallo-hydrolase [bacterium]